MDRSFNNALNSVIAEITPQPWEYATPDGVTLTVIPAGLRADPGEAEVTVRVTASKVHGAEVGITTTDLPDLVDALTNREPWEHSTTVGSTINVQAAATGDGTVIVITEFCWDGGKEQATSVTVRIPEEQRMPLVSALRRAEDVAAGWED